MPTPTAEATPTRTPSESSGSSPTGHGLPVALTGHVVTRIPTTRRVVALTFDGGSGAQAVASVLGTLDREGVRATFFLTGRFVETYPRATRRIARRGVVGNHSMTHPHLTQLSAAAVRSELVDAESVIVSAVDRPAAPWFRFPYGDYDDRALRVVNGLGYVAVGWTVDTLGWKGRTAGTTDDVVDRCLDRLQPGAIVLMHLGAAPDGSTLDADALPRLISAARAAGYDFVSIDALG